MEDIKGSPRDHLGRRVRISLLVFILLAGAAARLHGLAERSLWFDESLVVLEAGKPLPKVLSQRAEGIHPPLFRFIVHWFMRGGRADDHTYCPPGEGEGGAPSIMATDLRESRREISLRLLPVSFSFVSILLFFLLGRALLGPGAAALAAAIMSFSAFQVYYAQEIKMYALLQFLSLLSCLLLIKALKSGKKAYWAGYALTGALALYTHYFASMFLAAQAVFVMFYLSRRGDRRTLGSWAGSLSLLLIFFLPWSINALKHLRRVSDNFWLPSLTAGQFFGVFRNFFFGYHTGFSWFFTGWAVVPAVSLFGAVLILRKAGGSGKESPWDPRDTAFFIFSFLLVPAAAAAVLSLVFRPVFFDRPFIFLSGPCYLLFAAGLCGIWRRRRAAAVCLAAVFLLVSLFSLRGYYRNEYFEPSPGVVMRKPLREAGGYIARNYHAGDIVVLSHHSIVYPLACYLPQGIRGRTFLLDLPVDNKYDRSTLFGMLKTSRVKTFHWRDLPAGGGVWLICSGWNREIVPPPADMAEWLSRQTLVKEYCGFEGVKIYYYKPDSGVPRRGDGE